MASGQLGWLQARLDLSMILPPVVSPFSDHSVSTLRG
jgi:hypothetical protein